MTDFHLSKLASGLQALENILEVARPLNKDELCEYLRIEKNTLEYYNGQGLPRFKVGNEVRYYLPDVLAFFRERGIKAGKERYAYEAEA